MNHQSENTAAPLPLRWRIRAWLFRELFADEYMELQAALRSRDYCRGAMDKLVAAAHRPPARIVLQGGLTAEQIARALLGQGGHPALKAVEGFLMNKIVELSDKATDAPHGTYVTAEGTVPVFTAEDRLHLAGGAAYAAEILAELQELVAAQEEEKEKSAI